MFGAYAQSCQREETAAIVTGTPEGKESCPLRIFSLKLDEGACESDVVTTFLTLHLDRLKKQRCLSPSVFKVFQIKNGWVHVVGINQVGLLMLCAFLSDILEVNSSKTRSSIGIQRSIQEPRDMFSHLFFFFFY